MILHLFAIGLFHLSIHSRRRSCTGSHCRNRVRLDGDTLEIHGRRIRLFGIDAPERSQLCVRPTGELWLCGQQASFALADRIGRAVVTCQPCDLDRYDRVVAVCFKGN
jgi:endonuclease YncB( thermonuclease family)